MVGWSRRNRENTERNRKFQDWFDQLSEEQQQEWLEKHLMDSKKELMIVGAASLLIIALIWFLPYFIFGR